ncbi:hypothetical protein P152DRAFT_66223 [Eremomyces bilateralis CBS 781.70]|uniref:CFEM domain-containing protein n=1 Tax=Eremomyces bilateralis CBS 781.70 TaxID=1392243 RepID=A0A6G1FZC8_9PEZI|nr:uncharacterized protein P152DRAFT_66223 [Eremomyces bilateralis CBS 781.70]KAF1811225.1 hypothetical protein P152DRAFT_66223 [Eremomyces bilateralis CBS 781.70]
MKYQVALLFAAGIAAAVRITDFTPECADKCLEEAVAAGSPCTVDEAECQCEVDNYRAIYDAGVTCVLTACGGDVAINEVLPGAAAFCEEVIGPVATQVPNPGESSSAAPSSESSAATPAPATTTQAGSAARNGTSTPSANPPAATLSEAGPAPSGAASKIGAGVLALGGALAVFAL